MSVLRGSNMRKILFHFPLPFVTAMLIVALGRTAIAQGVGSGEAISRAFTIDNQLPPPPPQAEAISRAFTVLNQGPSQFTPTEAISRAFTVINLLPEPPAPKDAISRAFTVLNTGTPVCGDGLITGTEACDDGNVAGNDGCSSSCAVEDQFVCAGEPSVCLPDCNRNEIADGTDLVNCGGSAWCSDCNGNGILDACDISSGIHFDCNNNGVPDECEFHYGQTKLTAPDQEQYDRFGRSVSVDGNVMVIGTPLDDCAAGSNCGSAYVYRFNGSAWIEEQKLTASNAAYNDQFGYSVSVNGDVIVVGAYLDSCPAGVRCGSAYVYRFNGSTWIEEQELTTSDAPDRDGFGWSVSVSGDIVVVGAYVDDCPAGPGCGSAYVYRFNGSTWVEEQKLTASDADTWDVFGNSVSVSGDVIVVGAEQDACAVGDWCGSAYIYRFDGNSWIEEQKLTASDADDYDLFGHSISINGDVLIVGAFLDECRAGLNCGSAYIFRFNPGAPAWVEEAKFTPSDAAPMDYLGISVSVSGDTAVVGSWLGDCLAGDQCGSAYVYQFNGSIWVQHPKLIASDTAQGDSFGWSVSVSGETAVVGAFGDACTLDAANSQCGSAYVFALSLSDCNANGILDECDITDCMGNPDCGDCNDNAVPDGCDVSNQTSRDCNGDGVPDECAPVSAPTITTDFEKCRTISIIPGNGGRQMGLRVKLVSLHHVIPPYTGGPSVPFTSFEGQFRWVGAPRPYIESSGNPTVFYASLLQCDPYYRDWGTIGVVHVYGSEIVPSSTYDVQAIPEDCSANDEANFTGTLQVLTTRWGDLEIPFSPPSPNGQPDLGDVSALVNKFKGAPGAPIKARAVLAGSVPDFGVDLGFDHIAACVDAFKGKPYPNTIAACP